MNAQVHIFLLLIAAATIGACSSQVEPPRVSGTMSATLQGEAWAASDAYATFAAIGLRHELNVAGRFLVGGLERSRVDITIADVSGPGTYDITNTFPFMVFINSMHVRWNDADYHVPFTSRSNLVAGSVEIAQIDVGRVRGTFHATLYRNADPETPDTIVVAGGAFDVGIAR
ncbi:MAG TPA: hypothetical protein VHI13_15465 [Candidatus Kapabacteria bacterium]|nr:hypothetical protein [Candidatus Kapabacteria bacterium]